MDMFKTIKRVVLAGFILFQSAVTAVEIAPPEYAPTDLFTGLLWEIINKQSGEIRNGVIEIYSKSSFSFGHSFYEDPLLEVYYLNCGQGVSSKPFAIYSIDSKILFIPQPNEVKYESVTIEPRTRKNDDKREVLDMVVTYTYSSGDYVYKTSGGYADLEMIVNHIPTCK